MKALTFREKRLGLLVVVVCGISLILWIKKSRTQEISMLREELQTINTRMETLAKDIVNKSPDSLRNNRISLELMSELSARPDMNAVNVIRLDRTGDFAFKIVVEGAFNDIAMFLSNLERSESRFVVEALEVERIEIKTETQTLSYPVRGTFTFNSKRKLKS